MKNDVLTVQQQRARQTHQAMAAIGLEAQLRLLARDILDGDVAKIPEFHYWLRYAPVETNQRLLDFLSANAPGGDNGVH